MNDEGVKMSTLTLICLFFSICLLATVTKWYLACAGLIAVAIGVEVWLEGLVHSYAGLIGMVIMAMLVVADGRENKENSILQKYNPFNEKAKLNPVIRFVILLVFLLAFAIRLFSFFVWGR